MIKIPTSDRRVLKAKNEFYHNMALPVLDRLDDAANAGTSRIFLDSIEDQLLKILIGRPAEIFAMSAAINQTLTPANKEALKTIFDYDWFITKKKTIYDAYDLAAALEVNVCVYCNRNYTHTVIAHDRRKITRPTFDHYFSKGLHPLLALSFYNLIPSCGVCNSGVKHTADFQLGTHYHPYFDDYLNEYTFSYEYTNKTPSGLGILLNTRTVKSSNTLSELETKVIYNSHDYELKILLDMRYKFSDNYLSILQEKVLCGISISAEELYSIAFGSEMQEGKFGHRPFSKFKNDILRELGIIT